MYNAVLFNEWSNLDKYDVHKSIKHYEGDLCFGGGWFIVVIILPTGQISNHYRIEDWDKFDAIDWNFMAHEFHRITNDTPNVILFTGWSHANEIIKIFMITSSGAEGINLENTRFVHIAEPYWHPVRMEQVIGRAKRICSHRNLPEHLRNIQVYLYLSVLSEEQIKNERNIELRTKDVSRVDRQTPVTTDEYLF